MNPRSAIAKGKILENHIADRIVALGLDPKARRDGGSGNGNREKGDICTSLTVLGQNAGIEAKNQATLKIPDWWRQVKKLESLGREPILAFKIIREPLEETKVVIYLETFLELVKRANAFDGIMPSEEGDPRTARELRYAIQNAKTALSRVDKLLTNQ